MQLKKLLLLVLLAGTWYLSTAQKDEQALIDTLIKAIASAQVVKDGEFYKGMFMAYRQSGGAPHNYQPDNNIFFTAISSFALRNLMPKLSAANKTIALQVIQNARGAYPYFKNRYGDPFYNFWPTDAPIMPHTYYFKYLKNVFGQGEDADDAVMILMTSENDDSANAILKQRLIDVSNKSNGRAIISTYRKYRQVPAYSTYLGKKMTPDFDFAVQCNILYFMHDKQLPFTIQDSATLNLLVQMMKSRDYMKTPVYLSPYYVKSSILIYHLTRLMAAFNIPELDVFKTQLITDANYLLAHNYNVMDQIILRTSLLRLGAKIPDLPVNDIKTFEASNQQQYIFFQARAAFSYPSPFKQIFLHWSYITYYFYCPVYNKVLWLEYLVEKNSRQ